jgi:hypothetical protein
MKLAPITAAAYDGANHGFISEGQGPFGIRGRPWKDKHLSTDDVGKGEPLEDVGEQRHQLHLPEPAAAAAAAAAAEASAPSP